MFRIFFCQTIESTTVSNLLWKIVVKSKIIQGTNNVCMSIAFQLAFFLLKISFLRNRLFLTLFSYASIFMPYNKWCLRVHSMKNHLWIFRFCSIFNGEAQTTPWQFIETGIWWKKINPWSLQLLIIFPESSSCLEIFCNYRIQF